MTRQAQKEEELRLVEQLRRLLAGVLVGTIEPADEPDVRIINGAERVGVEVTELHQRPQRGEVSRRLQESERAGIVAQAQALAESAGMPVLDVAVHFTDTVPVGKSERSSIATALVTLVAANIPVEDGVAELQVWRQRPNPVPSVRIVRVFRASVLRRHHWAVPDSGWVQQDFVQELQQAIDEKNARYGRYRQHCDQCWLLVVASGGRPSGLFGASEQTRSHVYVSQFARTFFMEAFGGQLVELLTIAA